MRLSRIVTTSALLIGTGALIIGLAPPSVAQTGTPKPAVVRDIDNGDRAEIYREEIEILQFEPARSSTGCATPVPPGKRLVIEHVTTRAATPPGQAAYVVVKSDDLHFGTAIPLESAGTIIDHAYYVGAVAAKLRIDAGHSVCVLAARYPGVGQGTFQIWISGYLVPFP